MFTEKKIHPALDVPPTMEPGGSQAEIWALNPRALTCATGTHVSHYIGQKHR